jgi:ankyrin repeat protein
MINTAPAMDKQADLKTEGVLRKESQGKTPPGEKALDEKHPQLPIRLSKTGPNNGRELRASQAILTTSVRLDNDNNSTSGSWQHFPTPDGSAPNEIEFQLATRTPQVFGLQPTYADFYVAIKRGDISAVTTMLDSGANIERQDDDGATPLILAIYDHQITMIKLLLERGADVHYPIIELPPIYHAVMQGTRAPEIIELLLTHGADLNVTAGPRRLSPLHWAAAKGMVHAASFLISQGADTGKSCAGGKTAAEKAHLSVVRLPMAKGVELHARSGNGGTALIWAASNGHAETVEYLLGEGARIEDCDKDGTSKSRNLAEILRAVADLRSRVSHCQYIRSSGSSQATARKGRRRQRTKHQAEQLHSGYGSRKCGAYGSTPSSDILRC